MLGFDEGACVQVYIRLGEEKVAFSNNYHLHFENYLAARAAFQDHHGPRTPGAGQEQSKATGFFR